jgi:hypothetical protein
MQEPEITLWQERAEMESGVGWWKQIEEALDQVRFLVIVMTHTAAQRAVSATIRCPSSPKSHSLGSFDRR